MPQLGWTKLKFVIQNEANHRTKYVEEEGDEEEEGLENVENPHAMCGETLVCDGKHLAEIKRLTLEM